MGIYRRSLTQIRLFSLRGKLIGELQSWLEDNQKQWNNADWMSCKSMFPEQAALDHLNWFKINSGRYIYIFFYHGHGTVSIPIVAILLLHFFAAKFFQKSCLYSLSDSFPPILSYNLLYLGFFLSPNTNAFIKVIDPLCCYI